MKNLRLLLVLCAFVLLPACKTTVITEEDRELPDDSVAVEEVENSEEAEETEEPMAKDEDNSKADPAVEPDPSPDPDPDPQSEGEDNEIDVAYTADMSQSFIAFTGTKGSAVSHEGKFTDYNFSLWKKNGVPVATSIRITIGSMVTDSDGLTKHLLNEDFFESETYPDAIFQSTSVEEGASAGWYVINGTLTMKDTTVPLALNAQITDTYVLISHTLDRTAFNIGEPGKIDSEVPLEVKIVLKEIT